MGKLVTLTGPRADTEARAAGQTAGEGPTTPAGGPPGDVSEGLSLAQFLNVLRRRWGFIAGCSVLLTLLAAIVIFQLTPRYTAEATVLLDTRKTQVVDIQAVMSGLQSDASVVRSEVELLKSPALAAQVVQKLDLVSNKRFNPSFQPPTLWSRINPVPLVKDFLLGESVALPKSPEEQKQLELEGVEGKVMGALNIVNDGRSYIIKIRFEDPDPVLAAAIANTFADVYLQDQLEVKFAATRRATDWLNQHLAELRNSVRDSDQAVQKYKEDHQLTQTQQGTVTAQQLSELNSQLILASADRAQKEANLRQAQDALRSGGADSASQVLASPVIQQLKAQQGELRRREAELATRYKPAHPEMINIRAQIDDLNKKVREEADNIIRSLSNDLNASKSREASLRSSLQSLQQSTGRESQEQVKLRELEREADANRVLYENFLARFKQTSTQEDMQQADARLVSKADAPTVPTFPKKNLLTVLAFIISCFIGVGGSFTLEHLDSGFRDPDQVERLTGVPHMGLVPAASQSKKAHDLIVEQPTSSYAEAIRSVRTALHFSNVDAPPKVVLVTSSIPNEGKSIFAASLARSVAKSGARALVIDCDLRHPSQGKLFGSTTSIGLLSYFRDGMVPSRLIEEDKISRLHYLPVTEGASNPQDLLGSQQMKNLLDGLRDQYDLIVLDAPPVLAVSDAIVLSHLADASLFLIRWEETPRSVALGALKLLRAQGVAPSGFVLSRVNVRKHSKYGYGDTGYYYGRYGSYYGKQKKSA